VALVSQAEPGAPRGAAFRVFRDRLRGEWFVEGELD
jgi:hypothetical protein